MRGGLWFGAAGGDLESWFVPVQIRRDIWLIAEPGHVHSYLVVGRERAALLDTGAGIAPIAPLVRQLTDRPISVILTHNHFDHIGGAADFDNLAIHSAGVAGLANGRSAASLRGYLAFTDELIAASAEMLAANARALNVLHPEQIVRRLPATFDPDHYTIPPLRATSTFEDGASFDLGGRTLEVIHTPGHSPDSVCLLDRAEGVLFSADTVYAGPLYAQLPTSDLTAYRESLRRLVQLTDAVDLLLPSHNRTPLDPPIMREMLEGFEELLNGAIEPTERIDSLGRRTREVKFARFSILLPS